MNTQSEKDVKKTYNRPELKIYGDLRIITQTVGMNSANGDGSGNSGMDKTN